MNNKNNIFAKVVTALLVILMTLIIWTVQDTRAAVKDIQRDVTELKVQVGKLETWTQK